MNSYLSKKKRKNLSRSSLQICQFIQIGWSLKRTHFEDAIITNEKWTKNGLKGIISNNIIFEIHISHFVV
jgi:hypothetical protein